MSPKRKKVFDKSAGHCWYCGEKLNPKKWHIDHLEPIYRNAGVNGDLKPHNKNFENEVPSCVACNLFKGVFSLEEFRFELEQQIIRARKSSVNFRMCEKFGLINVKRAEVVFWFEGKIKSQHL